LPAGWKGLKALAPEGYRIFCWAKFSGTSTNLAYQGTESEGAPIFSLPTEILSANSTRSTIKLPKSTDSFSEEPRFYVTGHSGAVVDAKAKHHRLELKARGAPATVNVRFFSETISGNVTVFGTSSASGVYDAAALRSIGLTVALKANQDFWLAIKGVSGDDRTGPHVVITAPIFKTAGRFTTWSPISGAYTFKAEAMDRSGVARVEFFLNNGKFIGADTEAPYECTYNIGNNFVQYVYAVAYDHLGNQRKSFEVPFGDGTIGSSTMGQVMANQKPLVNITGPFVNSFYDQSSSIVLSADAWDRDGKVGKVEFYRNGIKLGEATAAPYIVVWNNPSTGTQSITAKAIDDAGAEIISQPITITVTGGGGDSDGDGLQDLWEVQYFSAIDNPKAQPSLDVDGDGMSNLAEQSAGTSPTVSSSRVTITDQRFISASGLSITWKSVPGVNYQIESSTDLNQWTVARPAMSANTTLSSWTDSSVVGARRFYRVKIP
jgi:hypothetical protein